MAGTSRFLSMEDTMETLQIDKAELDQFMADGKLSAIRDAGKLKFRREQVEELKTSTETGATVMLSDDAEAAKPESSEDFDDGAFIVGESTGESSDDEATIISIPGADPESSDTGGVLVAAGSDEDSDQTSIIPPSSDVVEESVKEEEESIFDFGTEDITLEETDHIDTPSGEDSDSGFITASVEDSDSDLVAVADDSSSDILADSDSSSDIITAAEDSSSDILSVSVGDGDGTETVSDILELSDESDDALASVQVDAGAADDESTASEEAVGSLLDTIDDAEESSSELLAVGEEGLETADTIDLTVADDDATATVAEVLEEPDATEAGVLTGGDETLEGMDDMMATDMESDYGGPALTEMALPDGLVFGPAPTSPITSAVLLLCVIVLLLGATYVACAAIGAPVPLPDPITQNCDAIVKKALAAIFKMDLS